MVFRKIMLNKIQAIGKKCLKNWYKQKISLIVLILCFWISSRAANETFATGSYIINMGIVPQNVNNGLRPYGLIYDLIKNNNVPIKWVISQTKAKDGVDFIYNGVSYKGGTFIIPAEFRNVAVNSKITSYGVSGATTISALTVNVTYTLNSAPNWTLDDQNGAIAETFLKAANIPSSAYNWYNPQSLGACNDIFVMPHADPTWATHSNLYYWNRNHKGSIWAGCHAVSVLENLTGSGVQMNFLSTTGLVPFKSHSAASPPYTHQKPTSAAAQYMGITDGAHTNGSEQVFLPKLGGAWRPTTDIIAYDATQSNVPSLSPGQAVIIAHGRAFGDNSYGWIMYEAGHNIYKATAPENIAAVRAFLNFSFLAVADKVPYVSIANIPTNMSGGVSTPLSVTASSPVGAGLTYQWTSTCGGTFSAPTSASTNFTPPSVATPTECIIHCIITDACGRKTFTCQKTTVSGLPTAVTDSGTVSVLTGGTPITNVRSNDIVDGGTATAANSTIAQSGTWLSGITLNTTTGAISVVAGTTPGTYPVTYQLCDLRTPSNCVTVVDFVTVTPLILPEKEWGTVASATGGTAITNVRINDMVNGVAATPSNSSIAQSGTWSPGITLNTTTGAINVVAGTPPGTYYVTYQLCDLLTPQNCATKQDIVRVTGDVKPITENGTVTAVNGGTAITNVRTNDTVNGAAATATNSTISQSGTWPSGITLNTTTGAITVVAGTTPDAYPVVYQLCDLAGPPTCDVVTDTIFVTGAINAMADKFILNNPCDANNSIATNLLNNDSNPGGSALRVTAVTPVGTLNGTMTYNSNGNITYTPTNGFNDVQVFTYTVCDNTTPTNICVNSIFAVAVGSGTMPSAVDDAVTIVEDNIATINVLTNDGAGLSVVDIAVLPTNGKVSVNVNGSITYIPNADYAGTDSFCYKVKNSSGNYGIATVTITITNDSCDGNTMTP